jgi:hypothetical protein
MTINYTTLLGLAKPVTGTETGQWGDITNDQITSLIEDAVANTVSFSVTSGDVTLTTTSGATNQARMAALIITGTPGTSRNVIAPSRAKVYQVFNQSNAAVVIKGAATTGVSIPSSGVATVAWNGSDFELIASKNLALIQGLGTGVATALGIAVNTTNGVVTQSGTLAASSLLLGGGSGTGISSTTTGTGVVTAAGNAVNTTGGLVTQSGALAASALLIGGGSGSAITSTTTGSGVLTALGNLLNDTGGLVTTNGSAVLSSKRINPRVFTTTSTTSITPDVSVYDQYCLTALAAGLTINAPTGTPSPVNGNKLIFRILDNGTSQTLTWNATFTAVGITLPTSTLANKMLYVGCIYNSDNTRWDAVALSVQA